MCSHKSRNNCNSCSLDKAVLRRVISISMAVRKLLRKGASANAAAEFCLNVSGLGWK